MILYCVIVNIKTVRELIDF